MLKRFIPLLFPIGMIACSQDSGVEPLATGSSEATQLGNYRVLPNFTFGEDGSRYIRDAESGKLVKKDMERSVLVVADEDSFDSLRNAYSDRKNENLEYPVNYFCSEDLLAINTDYSEVVTKDGKVLLNDASLLAGCRNISIPDYLKKVYESSDFPSFREIRKGQLVMAAETYIKCHKTTSSPTGRYCEAFSRLGVYAHNVYTGNDDPILPDVAASMTVAVGNRTCNDAHGRVFTCDEVRSTSDYMDSPHQIQYGTLYEPGWTSADAVSAVGLHAVWYGRSDEFYLKTAANADQTLASNIYNSYVVTFNN